MSGDENTREDAARWPRRGVLVGSAAAVAVLGVGAHRLLTDPANASAPALGSVAAGAKLDRWTVVAVHPVRYGAIPVVLETQHGRRYQVDVLARDADGPPGVANTDRFSLYVANQGNGDAQTDEEEGLGAFALAHALSEHEASASDLPSLLTLRERNAKHDRGAFGVSLQ